MNLHLASFDCHKRDSPFTVWVLLHVKPPAKAITSQGTVPSRLVSVFSPATCVSAMLYGVHFVNTTRKTALVWFVLDRPCLSGTS